MSESNHVELFIYRRSASTDSWEPSSHTTVGLYEKPYAGKYILTNELTPFEPLVLFSVIEVANTNRFVAYAKVLEPGALHKAIVAS